MPGNENKVCKLIKSLYGLKQAPKQWHQKFDEVGLSNGYLLNQADKCVDLTKKFLSSRFSIRDMGEADVILVSTPMDTSEKLMYNNGQAISQLKYSRVIGWLMYAMTCTRPDIAFVVGKLSKYTSNPGTQHWQAIQRVLKYLKKTMDYKLTYIGYPLVLEGYTDASWISNSEDNSSTSGWVFLLGGGVISWVFKKQTCITSSTMEYEFVALAAAGKEAEWLRNLILEIPLWSKPIAPISIRCDSVATLVKAYSQMYNGKSRYLGVRHSMIRELITNVVISIEFVRLGFVGVDIGDSCDKISFVNVISSNHTEGSSSKKAVRIKEMRNSEVVVGTRVAIPLEAVEEVRSRTRGLSLVLKRSCCDGDLLSVQFESKGGYEQ
ncbi:hypothetical protein Tco_1291792 [Tanacetum coccineum]